MATYAVGDLQGCYDEFLRLLEAIRFEPTRDRLWLCGDLVNRGPLSLEALRFVRNLGDSAVAVLGNHDLHLLAVALSGKSPNRKDTLDPILRAPDRDELLSWLRERPLMHHDAELGWALVHAGLPPQWDIELALRMAGDAASALRGPGGTVLLTGMYGDDPDLWSEDLGETERLRFTINALTRLRFCDPQGRLRLKPKGAPADAPPGVMPWFRVPGRRSANARIIFGHWSALGQIQWPDYNVWGLDTGCVWGGQLTALCLETGKLQHCACRNHQTVVRQ